MHRFNAAWPMSLEMGPAMMTTREEIEAREKCLRRFLDSPGRADIERFWKDCQQEHDRRRAKLRRKLGMVLEAIAGVGCCAFLLFCAWKLVQHLTL